MHTNVQLIKDEMERPKKPKAKLNRTGLSSKRINYVFKAGEPNRNDHCISIISTSFSVCARERLHMCVCVRADAAIASQWTHTNTRRLARTAIFHGRHGLHASEQLSAGRFSAEIRFWPFGVKFVCICGIDVCVGVRVYVCVCVYVRVEQWCWPWNKSTPPLTDKEKNMCTRTQANTCTILSHTIN